MPQTTTPEPFKFYENTFALSVAAIADAKGNTDADMMLEGDRDTLANGLIEKMMIHPDVADFIMLVATNYCIRAERASGYSRLPSLGNRLT